MREILGLLLVDDHAVVREGYRRLLERRSDLRIVGEAGDAAEGYRLYKECGPDVAILDLSLPDTGGIELIKRLIQRDPQARILAFSMHRDPLFATQALRAGALGYVTKSSSPDILIQAVYQVAARQRVLSPDIAPDMALTLLDGAADPFRELSPREFEVLRLVLDGHNAEEIGEALHISPKTAQNIHYQVKAKLGVRTDIELMRLALRQNLVQ
ncbi:MAG: response regulator transcription factor [Azonexus sp.]|nr:response regulator transcription factor [Azonexus sp.]MBP6907976.1 response regulator transcription factor [Azonexus sp.]